MSTQTFESQEFLKAASCPLSRDELAELAKKHGATDEVINLIEFFPDVNLKSLIEENAMRTNGHTNGQVVTHRKNGMAKKMELKEKTGKLTEPGKTIHGTPDRRLKGQESEAIRSARHMEHGYDGRGYVTDPATDARLAINRAPIEYSPTWKRHSR